MADDSALRGASARDPEHSASDPKHSASDPEHDVTQNHDVTQHAVAPNPDLRPPRVLCIDGGGIRGIIPAIVLAEIEARTGLPVCRLFDLVAGTSTGGILALGLTMPDLRGEPAWRAERIIEIYERDGSLIFPHNPLGMVRGIFHERYDSADVEKLFLGYFGDVMLSQAATDVMVTSYDLIAREALTLSSRAALDDPADDMLVRVAARATSAGPTYFEPVKATFGTPPRERVLVDGAVFAGNPSMCAFVELQRRSYGRLPVMISLGTGSLTRKYSWEDVADWGLAQWARPLLHIVVDGAAETVHGQLHTMLGDQRYHRFQLPLLHASDDLDNSSPDNVARLRAEAELLIKTQDRELDQVCALLTAH